MSNFDIKEIEKNMAEIETRMTKSEEEGLKNTLKHFEEFMTNFFL